MRRKNILICCHTYLPEKNGVAIVVDNHRKEFEKNGYNVTIATRYCEERDLLKDSKVYHFKLHGMGRIGSAFKGLDLKKYQQFLLNGKWDLIFFHNWTWCSEVALSILPQLMGKKVLVSHGVSFNLFIPNVRGIIRWLSYRFYSLSFKKKLYAFDFYVFLTSKEDNQRFTDKRLMTKLKLSNFTIIPNGVNPPSEIMNSKTIKYHEIFSTKKKIILCVSNYQVSKGQNLLLKSFLKQEYLKKNTVLVFIGSRFNKFTDQLKRTSGKELNNSIFFLENQSRKNIEYAYQKSSLFVLPSETEVMPLVLLEAMSYKLPFVAFDLGCISDLSGGKIIPYAERNTLGNTLKELIPNERLLNKLGMQGYRAIIEKFNWERIGLLYNSLITDLLKEEIPIPSELRER